MTHGCYRCRMHCVTDETQSSSYNFLARPTPHRILADPETCRGRAPGSVQILFLSLLELLLTSLPGGSGASTPGHVRIETPSLDLGAATPAEPAQRRARETSCIAPNSGPVSPTPTSPPGQAPEPLRATPAPRTAGGCRGGTSGRKRQQREPTEVKIFHAANLTETHGPGNVPPRASRG